MKEFFDFLLYRNNEPLERIEKQMACLAWICLIGFFTLATLMVIAWIVL